MGVGVGGTECGDCFADRQNNRDKNIQAKTCKYIPIALLHHSCEATETRFKNSGYLKISLQNRLPLGEESLWASLAHSLSSRKTEVNTTLPDSFQIPDLG